MRGIFTTALCSLLLVGCEESVFKAKVEIVPEPGDSIELTAERIGTDLAFSQYLAVWDSLLISSTPVQTDYSFHVADMKNNRELGTFMRKGQGPDEHMGLTPVGRIEKKYRLPVPLWSIWMDGATGALYGYCEAEDAVYRLEV